MKKTILKRILVLTIVFLMIISTPFSITENINNNPYVYAATTFIQDLESELFLQTLIPTLIAAGLVFKTDYDWDVNNGSQLHEHIVTESLKEYFETLGENYKPPSDPDGPNLGEIIKIMLRGGTLISVGYGLGKNIVEIPQMFWELVKSFVDENYDVGENTIIAEGISQGPASFTVDAGNEFKVSTIINNNLLTFEGNKNHDGSFYFYVNGNLNSSGSLGNRPGQTWLITFSAYKVNTKLNGAGTGDTWYAQAQFITGILPPDAIASNILGITNIIDNPNYDWNNNYTDTKVIPIPVEMDLYGNPKTDENGYYLPSIDVDEWLDVQPTEIPNLDPSGTPVPNIPDMPDIENPDDDEKTGILIYIGNILQLIVGQLSKIVEGVKTIVANTNQLVFNTPNPVFDPTTGEQIDPETGQPVEPEPEASTGDGIIGDGIDTNIPTDFEWGDFKHLLDIFFIFIYFIVILILILLKFLQIVFTGLPGIAPNTELFIQYPEILAGVNYVKNLQVGGMSITVQQAFEYIFMIFFYIFVIKQIRKLYNAHVYEESAENKQKVNEMRMDYYEKRTNQINEFNDWYHK